MVYRHAFSNRTHFRACVRLLLSSVKGAPRIEGEKKKQGRIAVKSKSADKYVGRLIRTKMLQDWNTVTAVFRGLQRVYHMIVDYLDWVCRECQRFYVFIAYCASRSTRDRNSDTVFVIWMSVQGHSRSFIVKIGKTKVRDKVYSDNSVRYWWCDIWQIFGGFSYT